MAAAYVYLLNGLTLTFTGVAPPRDQCRAAVQMIAGPHGLASVALPLLAAPVAAIAILAAEERGLLAPKGDPTHWPATAREWSGDGEVLFDQDGVRVLSHEGGRWKTLRMGDSIQSVARFETAFPAAAANQPPTAALQLQPASPAYEYIKVMGSVAAGACPALLAATMGAPGPRRVRCLFLGGGACSLPLLLATALPAGSGLELTAVDNSAATVQVAWEHFGAASAALDLVLADASELSAVGRGGPYDLVAVDLFGADNVQCAPFVAEDGWVEQLKALLSPDGVVLLNLHSDAEPARAILARARAVYSSHFPATACWRVQYQANLCLCASLDGESSLLGKDAEQALAERAAAVAAAGGWRFDPRQRLVGWRSRLW
jgi:hypothetical protein